MARLAAVAPDADAAAPPSPLARSEELRNHSPFGELALVAEEGSIFVSMSSPMSTQQFGSRVPDR